ncbi:unnamed protein product [Didymodactylos carnosus]|uniref:Uncharacterized protein n=1 Tax=Didymodactylos carnosus TaxID=1234261 RepID=A0A8S2UL63_9BILA|nr:unnamed protein product [Didymodactylos carnosus]CAF4350164.1 unnamed protein product [Didymodactylos carnosus]
MDGERTKDEMCSHVFPCYPRIKNVYNCLTEIVRSNWPAMYMKLIQYFNWNIHKQWLLDIKRTADLATKWQIFYNNAKRTMVTDTEGYVKLETINIPGYKDLDPVECINSNKS